MPELPEVEVLRRSLQPHLPGDRITSVTVNTPALREPLDPRRLSRDTQDREITRLRRRGKYLLIDLERNRTLVIHLGMSGRLTVVPAGEPAAPYEHLAFALASDRRLRLVDPRRFGLAFTAPTDRLDADRHLAGLGLEPFDPGFGGAALAAAAARRRGPVKAFLMDASIVVGLGNIYATEALWAAGIHPKRSVARIARARWDRLAEAVREVLRRAIAEGGTTLRDYADGEGNAGYFQVSLAVYGREGEPCLRCGASIRRIVQSNRSTFYCPHCQR